MGSKSARNDKSFRRKSLGFKIREFLIVCQGRETEKNYFEALREYYRLRGMDIRVESTDPCSMMDYAEKFCNKNRIRYNEIWCVFDKDDTVPGNFNEAVRQAEKIKGYGTAYSNPCFELWIYLHFQHLDYQLSTDECIGRTEKLYKEKVKREYKKNDKKIFELTGDYRQTAINNAHKLYSRFRYTTPADANPCTTVHLLIRALEKKAKVI